MSSRQTESLITLFDIDYHISCSLANRREPLNIKRYSLNRHQKLGDGYIDLSQLVLLKPVPQVFCFINSKFRINQIIFKQDPIIALFHSHS